MHASYIPTGHRLLRFPRAIDKAPIPLSNCTAFCKKRPSPNRKADRPRGGSPTAGARSAYPAVERCGSPYPAWEGLGSRADPLTRPGGGVGAVRIPLPGLGGAWGRCGSPYAEGVATGVGATADGCRRPRSASGLGASLEPSLNRSLRVAPPPGEILPLPARRSTTATTLPTPSAPLLPGHGFGPTRADPTPLSLHL